MVRSAVADTMTTIVYINESLILFFLRANSMPRLNAINEFSIIITR